MRTDIIRVNILGTGVHAINLELALAVMQKWIKNRNPHYVCVTPVHSIIASFKDTKLREIINNSGLTTPDGMPVVWTLKARGYHHVERVYGPDLLLAACEASLSKKHTHYFMGGFNGVCSRLIRTLDVRFPGLLVVGSEEPPYGPFTEEEDKAICSRICKANPDYLWVGLGSPRQEFWMSSHVNSLNVPIMLGVGAAFDFLSGAKPQAPKWMQRSGLEWLFRLVNEPGRLWKRYLISNPLFIWLSILQWTGLRKFPMD